MIQNVRGVNAQLQRLAFADPDCLAQARIKPIGSRQLEDVLAEAAARPRLRILQHNRTRRSVRIAKGQCAEGAVAVQSAVMPDLR